MGCVCFAGCSDNLRTQYECIRQPPRVLGNSNSILFHPAVACCTDSSSAFLCLITIYCDGILDRALCFSYVGDISVGISSPLPQGALFLMLPAGC